MTTPDGPRVKLLELPLLDLGGSTVDLAPLLALAILFAIALYGFLYGKNKSRWRFVVQSISLFIFVFAAHQTMCVLRSWVYGFQAIGKNDTIAFALLHIAVALIFMALIGGSIFCGWICPLGALQEWLGWLSRKMKSKVGKRAGLYLDVMLSIFALIAMIYLTWFYAPANFFFSENVSILFTLIGLFGLPIILLAPFLDSKLRYFRYISLFGRTFIVLIGIYTTNPGCTIYETEIDYSAAISFLGVIVATVVLSRAYCRFICPFGASFGLLSQVALIKIKPHSTPCTKNCGGCKETCPVGALEAGQMRHSACIRCGRCIEHCNASIHFDVGGEEQ